MLVVFVLSLIASTSFALPALSSIPSPHLVVRDSSLVSALSAISEDLGSQISGLLDSNGQISNQTTLEEVVEGIEDDLTDFSLIASAYAVVLENVVPTATPTSIPEAISIASSALPTATSDYPNLGALVENVGELILNSLSPSDLTENVIGGTFDAMDSTDNDNTAVPDTTIYPSKSPDDAPYSLSESDLRAAIYIPSTFEYGQGSRQPILFVPGTGTYGGSTYTSNLEYLFSTQNPDLVDPVYLNVPGALLGDAQVNAEYVAYAINYISSVSSNSNLSVLTWSQGNLNTQWALKYWPSTRAVVSDFIGISPDFHGTVLAYIICPEFPTEPCDPAVLQQEYASEFVATLRADGGDTAYVPATTVYSATDEVVQPQSGGTGASGYLVDASNNQVQTLCPGLPAGGVYPHEGVLYNPLAYALAVDALTHDGPADPARLDLDTLCSQVVAQGLDLQDVLLTEGLIVQAAINIIVYEPKTTTEPPIMSYAA